MKIVLAVLLLCVSSPLYAAECLTSITWLNSQANQTEKVSSYHNGHNYEIRHELVNDPLSVVTISTGTQDNLCPRAALDSGGATAVVFKASGNQAQIFYRGRKLVSGTWTWQSNVVAVSDGTEDAAAPYTVFHSDEPWVIWHESTATEKTVHAGGSAIGAEPWPTAFDTFQLGTTDASTVPDALLHTESGTLWATWVKTGSTLQYSEYSGSSWSTPSDITISNDDVDAARADARAAVLGL